MLMLIAPIKHLSEVAGPVTRGLAAVERGLDLIDHTPIETTGTYTPATGRAQGRIQLRNVSLRYPNSERDALQAINLDIHPGETIALVGSSGSGKTTLVNMLARFVDADSGEVLLDGVDIKQWSLDALRQQLSFVSQDVVQ
jgi:ATP-binding cassette, subfamily B, bacterial MsbA